MDNNEKLASEGNGGELMRLLKTRHITMIAMGGAIGTGLFIATGGSLHTAGPGGAIAAYTLLGVMVFFLMQSLGEMSTELPIAGSFETYATKFVDPALGFALGWNYWINWAICVACELAAAPIVMHYWFPNTSAVFWSVIFAALLFGLNALSARGYGESEYWFAGIKVVTVIIFLIVGVLMLLGVVQGDPHPAEYFTMGDAPFVGGILGFINVAVIGAFSFQGTELVGVAAGETENPSKNIPKATNTIFIRIMLFNIGSVVMVALLIPYTDPNLLGGSLENVAQGPYAMVFAKAGIPAAVFIMNLVLITAVLSAGNTGLYASSRMLYGMAKSGKAPKIFAKTNKRGVPMAALILTTIVGFASFLSSLVGTGKIYLMLVNASSLTGFIAWWGIAVCHWRFRKAYTAQGKDLNDLKFKARWYPFGPIFALVVCSAIIILQGISLFTVSPISWVNVLITYIGIPMVLIFFFYYKIKYKTKIVPLEKCNFSPDTLE